MEFLGYIFAFLFGALCLVLSHLAYKLGMPKKYTRKLVHIAIGIEWIILYVFCGATWHSFAICLAFTALLVVSYIKKLLPMISSEGENSPGTVYYGVSMSVLSFVCIFLPDMMLPFGIAVICTSLGDGFAGVVGQAIDKFNIKLLANKTLLGTLTNLAVSFFGVWIFSAVMSFEISVLDCLYIALFSVVLELVTPYGLDNVSVPLGTGALAYLLAYLPAVVGYVAPIIATPLIIAVALEKKVLTPLGTLSAVLLDVIVSVAFGNSGFAILVLFLVLSVITDKIKHRKATAIASRKRGKRVELDKKPRNEIQVLANGGAAFVCAFAYIFVPKSIFIAAFVAVMAEALADTVSSGFGIFADETIDLFRMKKCERGVSGGVSGIGTFAALVASFLLPAVAFALGFIEPIYILICGAVAFGGCFVDTFIGSLFQEKYICPICKTVTDEKTHCKAETEKHSGFAVIDNNVTNFISNVVTAVVVILCSLHL